MKVLVTGGCGYIGSNVIQRLSYHHELYSCDLQLYSPEENLKNNKINFMDLPDDFIRSMDCVIHLAGHSSVPWCELDPAGSLRNNCLDFMKFVHRLRKVPIIYASSASVYGDTQGAAAKETDTIKSPLKPYDGQKQILDEYMRQRGGQFFGLRFGTVCGHSSVPRNELLINAMVRDAEIKGRINASSAGSYRAVLGMSDLIRAVREILDNLEASPGIYNLASFSDSIGNIAQRTASSLGVPADLNFDLTTPYSFQLNTSKFEKEFNFSFQENVETIAEEARHNNIDVERKWCTNF